MNFNFYENLSLQSSAELLNLYTTKRNEYSEEFLMTIEKILKERGEDFVKINYNTNDKEEILPKKTYPFDKKLFFKVAVVIFIFGALGLFGKMVAMEGKLMKNDMFTTLAYMTYNLLSFPFAFVAEKMELRSLIFILYIINTFFWARLITYIITRIRNV
jgi:hypothetical protein